MLKRSRPLRRKTRIKPRSTAKKSAPRLAYFDEVFAPAQADSLENARRKEWLHNQPCALGALIADPCDRNPVQEAHCDVDKGVGLKSFHPTFPLCGRHHDLLGGQAKHKTVLPWATFMRRALEAMLAAQTERQWEVVAAHEERRKGLVR